MKDCAAWRKPLTAYVLNKRASVRIDNLIARLTQSFSDEYQATEPKMIVLALLEYS